MFFFRWSRSKRYATGEQIINFFRVSVLGFLNNLIVVFVSTAFYVRRPLRLFGNNGKALLLQLILFSSFNGF
jgi:hypothetical protein